MLDASLNFGLKKHFICLEWIIFKLISERHPRNSISPIVTNKFRNGLQNQNLFIKQTLKTNHENFVLLTLQK